MKYKVTYDDGTITEYKVKPRHLVQHEHETKKDVDDLITKSYKLAWMASESPETFKGWLGLVDDIEATDLPEDATGTRDPDGGDEVVPTQSPSLD
jgi:hypothetical protein